MRICRACWERHSFAWHKKRPTSGCIRWCSMPLAAVELIAARFGRAGLVEDSESLLWMMEVLGPEVVEHLRERLEHGEPSAAIDTVGLLTRIDIETVERILPGRMKEWKRAAHDRVVRQIAVSRAPARGRLLLNLFPHMDPLVRPAGLDG